MSGKFANDVLVVGGGPAGSTAAILLIRLGLRVLLLEKSHFPRKKLCGGMLTNKTLYLLNRVYGETPASLEEKGIVESTSNSYDLRINRTRLSPTVVDPPFVAVDRSAYDDHLLKQAKGLGVQVLEGDAVREVDPSSHRVLTSSGKILDATFILGADGVNSIVRKALPRSKFSPNRWQTNLAAGLEVYLPRADLNTGLTCPVIHFGLLHWGYGWIFPNRERILAGIGGLARYNRSMKEALRSFLWQHGYQKETLPEVSGYPIPYGNYLASPVQGPVLLLGDAAGLVDPFLGEGIYYAQRSAELASQCIHAEILGKGRVENSYPLALWNDFLRDFDFMMRIRWLLFGLSPMTGHLLVKLALNILGPRRSLELIQGTRSWRWFQKKPAEPA
jgi:menaquinone-9 beta-reductase